MTWKRTLLGIVAGGAVLAAAYAADKEPAAAPEGKRDATPALELKTDADKLGYAIGTQIGGQFKRDGIKVNKDILARAIRTVLEGGTPTMSREEVDAVIEKMVEVIRATAGKRAETNLAESKRFLEQNAAREGVRVLPSGLQYKILKQGAGATPGPDDKVKFHYRGKFLSGDEFDSSYQRNQPTEANVKDVIPGWREALLLMKEGDTWQLFIPPDLAYGPSGREPVVSPNSALIYEVELLEVVKGKP